MPPVLPVLQGPNMSWKQTNLILALWHLSLLPSLTGLRMERSLALIVSVMESSFASCSDKIVKLAKFAQLQESSRS